MREGGQGAVEGIAQQGSKGSLTGMRLGYKRVVDAGVPPLAFTDSLLFRQPV